VQGGHRCQPTGDKGEHEYTSNTRRDEGNDKQRPEPPQVPINHRNPFFAMGNGDAACEKISHVEDKPVEVEHRSHEVRCARNIHPDYEDPAQGEREQHPEQGRAHDAQGKDRENGYFEQDEHIPYGFRRAVFREPEQVEDIGHGILCDIVDMNEVPGSVFSRDYEQAKQQKRHQQPFRPAYDKSAEIGSRPAGGIGVEKDIAAQVDEETACETRTARYE
jgi:hypothetical protein